MPCFPREKGETFLVVFDFDDTVCLGNTDEEIPTHLGEAEAFAEINHVPRRVQWTNAISRIIGPYTKEQIVDAVGHAVKVPAETIEVFRALHALSEGENPRVDFAIASDANVLFIEESFKQIIKIPTPRIYSNGFVDLRETPEGPQTCPDTGRTIYSKLTWQSPNSHNCQRCKACPNMCKSAIVQKALNETKLRDPTVIFVGDGFNDSCPMQKVLRLRDHMFAHRGYRLEKILLESTELKGVCHHHTWSMGEDLIELFREVVGNDSKRLPPIVLMGNEGGSDNEFRTHYLTKMMQGIIGRVIDTFDEKSEETSEVLALLRQLSDDISGRNPNPQSVLSDPCGLTQRTDLLPIPSSLLAYGSTWRDLPWVHGCNYLYLLLWSIVWRYGSPKPVESLGGDGPLSPMAVPLNLGAESNSPRSWLTVDAIRAFAFPAPDAVSVTDLKTAEPQYDCFLQEKESVTATFFGSHIKPMISDAELFIDKSSGKYLVGEIGTESRAEIRRLLSACVWGNTVDLSMFNRAELADMSKQVGSPTAGHAADHNVLDEKVVANDMDTAAEYIVGRMQHYATAAAHEKEDERDGPAVIDVVMDNMGVECAADMLLGLVITELSPSMKVRYHTKPIPYYVSDVMPKDIERMLQYWEADALTSGVAKRFRGALASGRIEVHTHPYWVHPSEYREMPSSVVNAYFFSKRFGAAGPRCKAVRKHHTKNFGVVDEIIDAKSDLVIFKGDLNFRRVCGDRHWSPAMFYLQSLPDGENEKGTLPRADRAVPFTEVIGDYWPYRVVPMLALRTNKSEVCVGPTLEAMQKLDVETNKAWRCNGKYAVACFGR